MLCYEKFSLFSLTLFANTGRSVYLASDATRTIPADRNSLHFFVLQSQLQTDVILEMRIAGAMPILRKTRYTVL